MPRAKVVTAAQWPQYVAALGDWKPIPFGTGYKHAIAALVPSPRDVVWITQRLQEVAGIVAQMARGDGFAPSAHAEVEHVRRLREHAEAVEKGLRELWPTGDAGKFAKAEAERLFFGREPPAPPNLETHLGIVAYVTAQSLRVAERKLIASAKRGAPTGSVAREAVNLTTLYARKIQEEPDLIASLSGIVLDAASVPKAGRSKAVLMRYAKAALAGER